MKYQYLERQIELTGNEIEYFTVIEHLKEPTARVLPRSLDIVACLNSANLGDDYIVFGGYGVLSHMMNARGPHVAETWRGSDDLDIAGTEVIVKTLKGNYNIISDRPSPNLRNKRTLILEEQDMRELKIDFYLGHFEERFFPPEINPHFGVDFRVSSPLCLIRGKLSTHPSEIIHSTDIVRLLSVLEDRKYSPGDVARFFNSKQKGELINRLIEGYNSISTQGLSIDLMPSKEFRNELHKLLHKGRS